MSAPAQTRADNGGVTIDGAGPIFPAWTDEDVRWNGWLVPHFTREAAERVVTWLNASYAEVGDGSDRAEWDGDVVVVHCPVYEGEPGYRPERVEADEHGRYCIGGFTYTWCRPAPETVEATVTLGDWPVAAFGAWLTAARSVGLDEEESTHDASTVVGEYDEETVAGAVRYGRFWYLVRQDTRGGPVIARYAEIARETLVRSYWHGEAWTVESDPDGVRVWAARGEALSPTEARALADAIRYGADRVGAAT